MARVCTSSRTPALKAQVTARRPMVYEEGPCKVEDRPPHVRAASGLSAFNEYIAVIQDDANWLALIDIDEKVTAVPLPPGPSGARLFSKSRGNRKDKYDLEACITIPGTEGHELIGFSSGSRTGRDWILRVREVPAALRSSSPAKPGLEQIGSAFGAEFLDAQPFYNSMRSNFDFCGAGLNIEGAVTLDDKRILLFQRGNAKRTGDLEPVDATAELSWAALCAHLAAPDRVAPPALSDVRVYELGSLDGVRLTFSDAELLPRGRILFSASAEDEGTGRIAGSVLGVIEADGSALWTELLDEKGQAFQGKIEGLTLDLRNASKVHFVIDDDDEDVPSEMFEAVLSGAFFGRSSSEDQPSGGG